MNINAEYNPKQLILSVQFIYFFEQILVSTIKPDKLTLKKHNDQHRKTG